MFRTRTLAAAALAMLAVPAAAQEEVIVSVDSAVDAAVAAGLVDTLLSGDPYTVFLPTNAAIAAQPEDAIQNLIGDPEQLGSVVQGYVVAGTVNASDAMALAEGDGMAEALAGNMLTIAMDGDTLTVNGAPVIAPNLTYGPLTVHVIDGAFLPG